MPKKKAKKKIQKIQKTPSKSFEQVNEEKKPPSRHLMKDFLASLQLIIPAFFIILLTAEMLKHAYDANVQNLVFPALVLLLGISTIIYTSISGWITKMPYLVLPNFFYAFLFVVTGKNYIGHSLHYLFIATLIGIFAYVITSFFIKKDLWVKWIPEPIIKYLPVILSLQMIYFGLLQTGIIRLSVLEPIKKTFGSNFFAEGSYFLLSAENLTAPIFILFILGLACYLILKKRNIKQAFLWSMLFIVLLGFILPMTWTVSSNQISSFRDLTTAAHPYRPQIIQMIFGHLFGESGSMNLSQWGNFWRLGNIRNFPLIRFSLMTFFFMVFYSVFMHQNIQQAYQKAHPDLDRKDIPDATFNRMHAFTGLAGIFSASALFSYTEHSIMSLFAKGKTNFTGLFTSLWILIAILLIPFTGFFANPSLIAFIWVVFGIHLLESSGNTLSFKHLQEYLTLIPMLIIAVTTMNFVESLLLGIFIYSIFDIVLNYKNRKQQIHPSSYVWIAVVVLYYLFKINAF